MSGEVKVSFVQFDIELPIHGTKNVNTHFHNKLWFINLKFVLPESIFSYKTIYKIWVIHHSEEWYSITIIIVVVPLFADKQPATSL